MNKAEKYDIKEASNPELTKKARKNYADNAQHNVKKYDGPKAVGATIATVAKLMPMVKEFLGKNKNGKPKTAMDAASDSGKKALAAGGEAIKSGKKDDKASDSEEKDDKASDSGKKALAAGGEAIKSMDARGDKMADIMSSISMRGTSMGCGVNMKSGCQVSKHMSR